MIFDSKNSSTNNHVNGFQNKNYEKCSQAVSKYLV